MLVSSRLRIREFATKIQSTYDPAKKQADKIQNDQIKTIATEALSMFDKHMIHSVKQKESLRGRIEMCSALSDSLKMVASRVHRQKGLIERISAYFIYANPEEKDFDKGLKKISAVMKKSQVEYTQLFGSNPLSRLVNWISYQWTRRLNTFIEDCLIYKLKEGFFRVIGQNKMISKEIEGCQGWVSFANFKRDLQAFLALHTKHLNPTDKKNIESIIEQLNKSYVLERQLIETRIKGWTSGSKSRNAMKSAYKEIMYDVAKEIENLKAGESMIFPGGFTTHAVIYKVRREKDNTYTFVIINTGAGATVLHSALKRKNELPEGKCFDDEFVNLKADEITNPEFLMDLGLAKNIEDPENKGVMGMLYPLLTHLLKGTKAKIISGREHELQVNGTCTYSSIESWLESELDPVLFKSIIQFMNKKGLQNLQEVRGQSDLVSNSLIAEVNGEKLSGVPLLDRLIEIGKKNSASYREQFKDQIQKNELMLAEAQAKVDVLVQKSGIHRQDLGDASQLKSMREKFEQSKVSYYRMANVNSSLSFKDIVETPDECMTEPKMTRCSRILNLFQKDQLSPAWNSYTKNQTDLRDLSVLTEYSEQQDLSDLKELTEFSELQEKIKELMPRVLRLKEINPISEACVAA